MTFALAESAQAAKFWKGTGRDSGTASNWRNKDGSNSNIALGGADNFYIRDYYMTGTAYKRSMTLSADANFSNSYTLYIQSGSESDPFTINGNGKTVTWNSSRSGSTYYDGRLLVGSHENTDSGAAFAGYTGGATLDGGTYKPAGIVVGGFIGSNKFTGYLKLQNATVESRNSYNQANNNTHVFYGKIVATDSSVTLNRRIYVGGKQGGQSGSMGEYYNIDSTLIDSEYIVIGSFTESSDGHGYAYMEVDGGMVSNKTQTIILGDNGTAGDQSILNVKRGIVAANDAFYLGSGGSGTVLMNGGELDVSRGDIVLCNGTNCKAGEDSALVMSNGVVKAKTVKYGSGAANATILFDGGTLQAVQSGTLVEAHSRLAVSVGPRGGIIDANGKNATNESAIAGTGGMTVKGGGSLTVTAAQGYTGGTTVEAGTVLRLNTAAKDSLVAHDVTVAVPAGGVTYGTVVVLEITDSGTFSQAEVDAMSVSGDTEKPYRLVLADSGKTIRVGGPYATLDTSVTPNVWRFFKADGTPDPDWTDGVTGDVQVRITSYDEYAAIRAMGDLAPASFLMIGTIVIPAGEGVCDLSDCPYEVAAGELTFDANGRQLKLPNSMVGGAKPFTVTSSAAGGELTVDVGSGATVVNSSATLSGSLKLVKEGAGTFIASRANQSYTGGTLVNNGTVRFGISGSSNPFGVVGTTIETTSASANIDAYSRNVDTYAIVLGGGKFLNTRNSAASDMIHSIGALALKADSEIRFDSQTGITADKIVSDNAVWDLGGHTLTITYDGFDPDIWFASSGNRDASTGRLYLKNGTIKTVTTSGDKGWWHDTRTDGTEGGSYDIGTPIRHYGESTVSNLTFRMASSIAAGTGVYKVYGTFAPLSEYGHNVEMMDGSVIDLSPKTGAWNTIYTPSYKVTFAANATVTVNLAGRADLWTIAHSASPYVVTWETQPNATFVPDAQTAGQYKFVPDASGLRIESKLGFVIMIM